MHHPRYATALTLACVFTFGLSNPSAAAPGPGAMAALKAAAQEADMAVAELAPVLYAFKRGRNTVSRQAATLHRPH